MHVVVVVVVVVMGEGRGGASDYGGQREIRLG